MIEPEIVPEEEKEEEKPKLAEAAVWRLGPGGSLISSVHEDHAPWLAEQEPYTIFFYADLDSSATLVVTNDTMQKIYRALAAQGLTEGQIITAVSAIQHEGVVFYERAG